MAETEKQIRARTADALDRIALELEIANDMQLATHRDRSGPPLIYAFEEGHRKRERLAAVHAKLAKPKPRRRPAAKTTKPKGKSGG